MDRQGGQGHWRRWAAVLLKVLAGLVAVAGLLAALAGWAIMAFYPDDQLNTWLQNATPLLVYILPSWACAILLVLAARRLSGGPQG